MAKDARDEWKALPLKQKALGIGVLVVFALVAVNLIFGNQNAPLQDEVYVSKVPVAQEAVEDLAGLGLVSWRDGERADGSAISKITTRAGLTDRKAIDSFLITVAWAMNAERRMAQSDGRPPRALYIEATQWRALGDRRLGEFRVAADALPNQQGFEYDRAKAAAALRPVSVDPDAQVLISLWCRDNAFAADEAFCER